MTERLTILLDDGSGSIRPELAPFAEGFCRMTRARSGLNWIGNKPDRLGRSMEHLIELSKLLQTRGADLVVLDQGIDTSTAIGRMFFGRGK